MTWSTAYTCKEDELPCPLCVLCKNNTQVCKVLVWYKDGELHSMAPPGSNVTGEIAAALVRTVIMVKHSVNVKIGNKVYLKQPSFTLEVGRIRKETYSICFHAKKPACCNCTKSA